MSSNPEKNPSPGVRFVEISADIAGQRIDNYLLTHLKGAPRSLIYRILRRGEVRVNKGRAKPDYRLKPGDSIRIPPVRLEEKKPATPANRVLQLLKENILFEDKRLLVLNKPSGLAVHGGSGLSYGVIEGLRALRPKAPYLELVHRLDRDTSGCLLIAKKRSALRQLHELLRENTMDKRYLALVQGKWRGNTRTVSAALRKNMVRSGERIVRVDDEGKAAKSIIRPVSIGENASLIEVELKTGRTHQARVHTAHIGHPIAGDEKYGDEAFNRAMRQQGLSRLFLHARSLTFKLTEDDVETTVKAPLPDELLVVLNNLKLSEKPSES